MSASKQPKSQPTLLPDAVAEPRDTRLVDLLMELAQGEGFHPSRIPGVKFMRSSFPLVRSKVSYDPSIVVIAQGRKRGYLGDQIFTYDANHYLVLSVPLPFECETLASPDGPLLGISIGVTPAIVAEIMMEMEKAPPIPMGKPQTIRADPLDDRLYDAVVRLVEALRHPTKRRSSHRRWCARFSTGCFATRKRAPCARSRHRTRTSGRSAVRCTACMPSMPRRWTWPPWQRRQG